MTNIKLSIVCILLSLCLWAAITPAQAVQPPTTLMVLSAEDKSDIKRIEDYLNSIGTLKSRFMQMTSKGDMRQGDFFLSRPGRLRIVYDPPNPYMIVSNGIFLLYEDTQLEQKSFTLLNTTPAAILVKENLKLTADGLAITKIERGANAFRVSLIQVDDPYSGTITLVFTDRPLMLRQWTVFDVQGTITDFALIEPRFGIDLEPELFEFSMENTAIKRRD
ncbi:MAG: outer membrane lipoprotein carrier protein LolA [Rhodospirillales bacterium]|jgi:outer membrane lipoprotein-sorting protein|nr:outer membrane lipoprotein carrier protein LolA [Rhodospirillales bacterium]